MDQSVKDAIEFAHCAKINFENVVKMNPGLNNHPIFRMAMGQLQDTIDRLEGEGNPHE